MAENSKIEWTHHTFNPWRGCTKVSDGCRHCYAETLSGRNPKTLGMWGPNGTRVVASESMWREPLKWDSAAKAAGERHRVFCASLADVFEDWQGPLSDSHGAETSTGSGVTVKLVRNMTDRGPPWTPSTAGVAITLQDVRNRLFAMIDATPNLDWLLLTKRPENAATMLPFHSGAVVGKRIRDGQQSEEELLEAAPSLPNLWLGVSVENQAAADERIPHLLNLPVKVRFLSCEPLLGPVDLLKISVGGHHDFLTGEYANALEKRTTSRIDWVIVGGESGADSRPMKREWAISIRDQCQAAGVSFFFKQWGDLISCWNEDAPDEVIRNIDANVNLAGYGGSEWFRVGKKNAGRLLGSREWSEFPKGAS